MATIESQFKKWVISNNPLLKKDRILRRGTGERKSHLRFHPGCGIHTLDSFLEIFKDLPITPNDNYTGSPLYKGQGFDIKWKNSLVGVLFGVSRQGDIERKKYTPKSLGLNGKEFNNSKEFRKQVIAGLTRVELDSEIRKCLISMIGNLEGQGPIDNHPFLKHNSNKITSDFGEILAAYKSCLQGNQILFPNNSNNTIADYYANGCAYSAKGRKAGGKVNLVDYKNLIDLDSDVGKFLYSLADHNKNDFFKYGALLCPQAAQIAKWTNGTTQENVKKFVSTTKYDDFYTKVNKLFDGFGVPLLSKDSRPRELWAEGDTNPFYFTLNTIIHRYWGLNNSKQITEIVSKFLNKAIFIHIDIKDLNIITEEVPFENIDSWQTAYWSRATKAWHNWMAVEPVKEKK